MPCRSGCSAPTPGPLCCCAQRRGSARHRPRRDGENFCTADTCSNPDFCITYRPHFCPNAVSAPPNQTNPDAEPPQFGHWPPPFPDISTHWPPPYCNHLRPLSSTANALHSQQSIPSLHPLSSPYPNQNQQPCSTQSGNPIRRKSTPRLSIGKPSLTRLDSEHDPIKTGLSRPDNLCAMGQRLAAIGRLSLTHLDGFGCLQTDHSSFGGNHPSPNGPGVYSDFPQEPQRGGCGGRAQPIGRFQQPPQVDADGNALESDLPEVRARCLCRMPPAFARYRCTGNLSGLCDCPHCDDNK